MASISTQREAERWVAGYRHNQRQHIGRFPCEIWVEIIPQLDNTAIWSLRNTCRFFLESCEVTAVARNRCSSWRPDTQIVPRQQVWWGMQAEQDGIKDMLNAVQFCAPCKHWRAQRLSLDFSDWEDPLPGDFRCSACKIQHPKIFYSAPERGKASRPAISSDTIACVGRQASIPICDHVSVTWDKVQSFSRSSQMHKEADRAKHEHHLVCRHHSHGAVCMPYAVPKATLSFHRTLPSGRVEIRLQWEAAIVTLPTESGTEKPPRLSYSQLRSLISTSAARRAGSLPQLLCPHLSWEDNSLLRPFDPTYCCCLGAGVSVPHDAERCKLRGLAGDCCLCRSTEHKTAGEFLPRVGEGIGAVQLASHRASCTDCSTWYSWARRKDRKTGEQVLWLKMEGVVALDLERHTRDLNPCDMAWLGRIDPASVPGHWDREPGLKHLTWCDDSDCATSYRGRARTRVLTQIGERRNHPLLMALSS